MPVIAYLRAKGHRVWFAGNQAQNSFIGATFPAIDTIYLEGYNVRYASAASLFMPVIIKQVPSLLGAIKREHAWLKETARRYQIDLVISDNRYGIYHDSIPSVILTHQLNIITGMGAVADSILRRLHYKFLGRFAATWVVDIPQSPGLAGRLSHPVTLPPGAKYIGLLSQAEHKPVKGTGYLLVLLSGPEPQRTILADKLWGQAKQHNKDVVFVEGSNDVPERKDIPQHVTYHKQLVGEKLTEVLSGADMIVCRSGYSTLMDLVKLGKKAILIPTPGQTEQEYLAKELYKQKVFTRKAQQSFNLEDDIVEAENFPFRKMQFENAFDMFKPVLDDLLNSIQLLR